jgi:hypothetical protein
MTVILSAKWRRAERRRRTLIKARKAQQVHLQTTHPDGALDCVCERSVWYFAKRKSLGHHHHCEMCHPRYRNSYTRIRVKRFMLTTGLRPYQRQINKMFYEQ